MSATSSQYEAESRMDDGVTAPGDAASEVIIQQCT